MPSQTTQTEALSIAEVTFYAPAFLLGLITLFRQRAFSWIYLVLLPALRIIGSSCTLYISTHYTNHDRIPPTSLLETAIITSAIGLSPLLLVLNALLQRLSALPSFLFHLIHLAAIGTLIPGILGGVDSASSSDVDKYRTGRTLTKVSGILFLVIYLALAIMTLFTASRQTPPSERKLKISAVCVLPFLLVRCIYTVESAFSSAGSEFYFISPNVWIEAFMMFAMEAIALCFYVWAGLFTPRQQKAATSRDGSGDVEMPERKSNARARELRSIGDYRPSRLLVNAIRDRS